MSLHLNMDFKKNEKVVYPYQGVGFVKDIIEKSVFDKVQTYYEVYLIRQDMTVMVPVQKADELGLRSIINNNLAKKVLDKLDDKLAVEPNNWKERIDNYNKILKSGDIISIVEIVKILYKRSKYKELPIQERKLLDKSLNILIDELSLVLENKIEDVELMIKSKLDSNI